MTVANDSITVSPGAGATVATHLVQSKEHQVVMVANPMGHIVGALPLYRLFVPAGAAGANKVYFDLFNATGSGVSLRLLSLTPIVSGAVAVTGTLAVDLFLTRTSTIGTGGTGATAEGTSLTAMTLSKMDPADASLPAGVTARLAPGGGAAAGAVLSGCSVFTEETNAAAYLGHTNDLASRGRGLDFGGIIIPTNTGVRVVQGTVASVGNIGFDVLFAAE